MLEKTGRRSGKDERAHYRAISSPGEKPVAAASDMLKQFNRERERV